MTWFKKWQSFNLRVINTQHQLVKCYKFPSKFNWNKYRLLKAALPFEDKEILAKTEYYARKYGKSYLKLKFPEESRKLKL